MEDLILHYFSLEANEKLKVYFLFFILFYFYFISHSFFLKKKKWFEILIEPQKSLHDQILARIGAEVPIKITHIAQNQNVTTLIVEIPKELEGGNRVPHITVATLNSSIPAYYSNTLLASLFHDQDKPKSSSPQKSDEGGKLYQLKNPIEVSGLIAGFF